MSEWKETEFGQIPCEWEIKSIDEIKAHAKYAITMGPFGSNIKADNFVSSGIPVIRGTNLNYRKYVDGEFVYLTEEKANELRGSNCKPGDLVFTHRGTIGQVGLIPQNKFSRYVISQSGMKLTVNEDLMNNEFLFYFFISEFGQYQLLKYESQVGVPSISNPLTSLKEIKVPVPTLIEQQAIAEILSSLDDKIDHLYRQNKTLEAMAETLFRQWFIKDAEEGWEIKRLEEIFDIKIGRTPPRKEKEWFSLDSDEMKWVSIKDMGASGVYILNTAEFLTRAAVKDFHIPVIPVMTVLLSFKMTVGRVGITSEEMVSNEAIAHFKMKPGSMVTAEYLYCYLKSFNYESLGSTSSIVTAINSEMIKKIELSLPPIDLMKKLDDVAKNIFAKILYNQKQIQLLVTLRNILLPKLMSGEIRINL